MTDLIPIYLLSCKMAEKHIALLTAKLNLLKKNGGEASPEFAELKRRIHLLYIERADMMIIINTLSSYPDRRNADE